jgi:aspartate/glutamate racemase
MKVGNNKKNIATGGKTVYGGTVGVCMLDTQFPRIHGDIANARTWSVPVHYRVVPGATPKQAVYDEGKEILNGFIDAAKELVRMGADGITTNCGFLSLFQEKMAEAVNVPVATSSLMQVQMVQSLLPKNKKVGIMTIHKPSLKEAHLKAANVPLNTPIIGTENGKEFTRVIINDEKEMDIDLARQDHLDAAEELIKINSNIGAIVMECTNMSPFAADVRKKFGIPVFNIYTFIEWFQSGLLPTRFNPDHDDPRR